jgi:hypothetical protein
LKHISEWIRLSQKHPIKGLEDIFIQKAKVEYISKVTIEGVGWTSVVYRDRWDKLTGATVLEEPQYIMKKISY